MASSETSVTCSLRAIGFIRSDLQDLGGAPKQGSEGAPDAWVELASELQPALLGIEAGDDLILITWLHRARREVLQVHPRDDVRNALCGVFNTRSQDRPNPLGLHRVTVREVGQNRLRVGPIEVIDGTPVVDMKAVLVGSEDS